MTVRNHGRILVTIWRNRDFVALSREDQAMYMALLAQKDVNNAGVQPLMVDKWAKGCDELTDIRIRGSLARLEAARFVGYDEDTDELLIRTFIKNDGIAKQPNVFKNALRVAEQTESAKLRSTLADELDSLRRKDASEVASRIRPEPIENPSETLPEPLNPSGTLLKACGDGDGEGEKVTSRIEKVGRSRARATNDDTAQDHSGDAPPPRCPKHLNDPTERPCGPCGIARKRRETWDREDARLESEAAVADRRRRAETVRAERAACGMCDPETGYRGSRVCDHNPDRDEINRRGIQLVRDALPKNGTDS